MLLTAHAERFSVSRMRDFFGVKFIAYIGFVPPAAETQLTNKSAAQVYNGSGGEVEEGRTAGLRQELEAWFRRVLGEEFPFPTAPEGLEEGGGRALDMLANSSGFFQLEVV